MDRNALEAYAKLIVEKGLNPDPGQAVVIMAGLDQPEFVQMVVEECYKHQASRVFVDFISMELEKLDALYRSEENLGSFAPWELEKWRWKSENLPCRLWLDSDDPDGMEGTDQAKRARAQQMRYPQIKPFRDAMENRHQWCIAGVPGKKWACKVFPGVPAEEAEEKLWRAILRASRAEGAPIANWEEHNRIIHERAAKLNSYHFASLEYRSANGTSFRVGLMQEGRFQGAAETDLSGRVFNPNIPSEELFTTPKRGVAEGLLVATKPLSWQGVLIEDFSIRFENGKVAEVRAARGQEALEKLVAMDEGAAYLGECALISCDSPINNMGILFYNTLYDENACCHFALGRGFNDCVENFEKNTQEELHQMGVNDSMIHVDFMVGSQDLAITGITPAGGQVAVFREGTWCF